MNINGPQAPLSEARTGVSDPVQPEGAPPQPGVQETEIHPVAAPAQSGIDRRPAGRIP